MLNTNLEKIKQTEELLQPEKEKTLGLLNEGSLDDDIFQEIEQARKVLKQLQSRKNHPVFSFDELIDQQNQRLRRFQQLEREKNACFQEVQQEQQRLREEWAKISQTNLEGLDLNLSPEALPQPPQQTQPLQQTQPRQNSSSTPQDFLRYILGVGVVGPLAGLAKYVFNHRSFFAAAIVVPTLLVVVPTASFAFIFSAGLVAHVGVALYQNLKADRLAEHIAANSKPKPAEVSSFIQNQTFTRPIAQAVIFGFKTANKIAGPNNEPYGEKAYELCLKLENPKIR